MSRTLAFNLERSWAYVGQFYGIDAAVLAAYNNAWDVDLEKPLARGTRVKIPNAQELTNFYPDFARRFGTQTQQKLVLPPPTLTDTPRAEASHDVLASEHGNQVVVAAARMRRFSHTGDNYKAYGALRSPNPNYEANNLGPDRRAIRMTEGWFKCNILVGDALYAAGYSWPMSKFKRYLQPKHLIETLTTNRIYAETVYIQERFKTGTLRDDIPSAPITLQDLSKVRPGDVVALHAWGGLPGHSAIATSLPEMRDGSVKIRMVDIYGEQWYDVNAHNVAAIFRPTRKRWVPNEPVGGNINFAQRYLDGEGVFGKDVENLDDTYQHEKVKRPPATAPAASRRQGQPAQQNLLHAH